MSCALFKLTDESHAMTPSGLRHLPTLRRATRPSAAPRVCRHARVAVAFFMLMFAVSQIPQAAAQGTAPNPSGAEVEITYPAPRAEVGEAIVLTFDVVNATEVGDPRVPTAPGLRSQINRSREMSQTSIINGRVTQRKSVRFDVFFIAEQPGRFEIPRARIVVDGQTYESREVAIDVSGIDTSRMARAELLIDPMEAIVGQNVTATLRIWIRPPRQARMLSDPTRLWGAMIMANESRWGIFQSVVEALYSESRFKIPPRTERDTEGNDWVVYELATTLSPDKPGPMTIPGIEVRLRYPRANGTERVLTLEPTQPPVIIAPPPDTARPADYTGAVGVFEIDARAKPTRVSVGDPVTLSVVIVDRTPGGADLARLLPPPISEQPDLQRSFRMPSEPLVGTVNGRTKVFTQTLRPLSERVTEIPPVAFSFFDPVTKSYRTVMTQSIPITVLPAERIDAMTVTGGTAATKPSVPDSKLTEVEGGLVASVRASPAMLASDRVHFEWTAVAVIALPPLLAVIIAVGRRRRERLGSDERLQRSRIAPRRARAAIASAPDAPALSAALQAFLADRCGIAAASLTRREALALLAQLDADDDLSAAIDRLLATGERAAFANTREAPPESLRNEAKQLLARLERLDFSVRSGGRS